MARRQWNPVHYLPVSLFRDFWMDPRDTAPWLGISHFDAYVYRLPMSGSIWPYFGEKESIFGLEGYKFWSVLKWRSISNRFIWSCQQGLISMSDFILFFYILVNWDLKTITRKDLEGLTNNFHLKTIINFVQISTACTRVAIFLSYRLLYFWRNWLNNGYKKALFCEKCYLIFM